MDARSIADTFRASEDVAPHFEAVRGMFDRIAPTYDLLNRVLSLGLDVGWRKRAVRSLDGVVSGPLLDSCAGTLDLAKGLSARFPDRALVAADISVEMLERGRGKAPRAHVVIADATDLPFEAQTFAGVICGFGMRNVADPQKAMHEAWRVLKPGGRFVTLEFFRPLSVTSAAFHRTYASLVLPFVGALISRDRVAYRYLSDSIKGFWTRTEYEGHLKLAGFHRVRGKDLAFGAASIVIGEVSE